MQAKYKTFEFQGGERKFGNFKEGENDKGGGNAHALNATLIMIDINSETLMHYSIVDQRTPEHKPRQAVQE